MISMTALLALALATLPSGFKQAEDKFGNRLRGCHVERRMHQADRDDVRLTVWRCGGEQRSYTVAEVFVLEATKGEWLPIAGPFVEED